MFAKHIPEHRASTPFRRKPPKESPALRALKRALAQTSEPALKANLVRAIEALEPPTSEAAS
jgi:hypothetical protein